MEWSTIIESAIGSSPVAAISFYWARQATNEKREQAKDHKAERQQLESDHAQELASKDMIIARKDETIANLQESRIADLRAVMKVTPEPARLLPPKPSGSKLPF